MKKIVPIIFLSLILLMNSVIADQNCYGDSPPSMNLYEFYGTVYFEERPLREEEFGVIAQIGGEQVGYGEIDKNGIYAVEVTKCLNVDSGKIDFFVGDAKANESGLYTYEVPDKLIAIPLDLHLNKYPNASCGNGKIDGADECDDGNTESGDGCSSICEVELHYNCIGAPSICTIETDDSSSDGNSGGPSGGGGGGSSGSESFLTNQENQEFSEPGTETPQTQKSAKKTQETTSAGQGITGAVIGGVTDFVKSKKGIIIFTVLIVIIGAFIAVKLI